MHKSACDTDVDGDDDVDGGLKLLISVDEVSRCLCNFDNHSNHSS